MDRTYPDVPMGVVLPELDGDVRDLAGQDINVKAKEKSHIFTLQLEGNRISLIMIFIFI